jgi:hypothetical protein
VDGKRFGAGEAKLLEEVDPWGGCGVGVAVEFLMGGLEEAHDEFASVRMPCEAELWRDSRYILAAWGRLVVKESRQMGSSPKRNLQSNGLMPPKGHITQIWRSMASVKRVRKKSSLVIVLPVTVLFPIVVNFLISAVWKHRSALAVYKEMSPSEEKHIPLIKFFYMYQPRCSIVGHLVRPDLGLSYAARLTL